MKIKISVAALALLSFIGNAQAEEGGDNAFDNQLKANYEDIKQQVCDQLDLSVNVTAGPFFYTDPNASCDLGFQMPGLPDFNLGFQGLDSCSLLQAVTGDMVNELNQEMQGAVDGGLDAVGVDDGDFEVDFGDIVIDEIDGG